MRKILGVFKRGGEAEKGSHFFKTCLHAKQHNQR
jgi:hypothetical protein